MLERLRLFCAACLVLVLETGCMQVILYDEEGDAYAAVVDAVHQITVTEAHELEDSAHGGTAWSDAEATGELPAVGGV